MRAVLQRVVAAQVAVDDQPVAEIGPGLLIYLAVGPGDDLATAEHLAARLCSLRIFPDQSGRMNRSVLESQGQALVISQFTLYADSRRGHRPSFLGAAPPEGARDLCRILAEELRRLGVGHVAEGSFGAHMRVSAVNDGPVTIVATSGEGPWDADCG
ncbi:MAG: D-aminoacyl-tRNA deacylase [Candidatus Dormibacteria bacterium]